MERSDELMLAMRLALQSGHQWGLQAVLAETLDSLHFRVTPSRQSPPVDIDLELIILVGGLVAVDRWCDAFQPARAF